MSAITLGGLTALFGAILETNKHQKYQGTWGLYYVEFQPTGSKTPKKSKLKGHVKRASQKNKSEALNTSHLLYLTVIVVLNLQHML